ncbi:MAG: preprotein translocase subunit SecE [Anaerolineales bacterium]
MKDKSRSKKQNIFQSFFRETTGELRKVSWPTWPEVRQLTGIVLAVMVVMGIILWITDGFAQTLLRFVLNL